MTVSAVAPLRLGLSFGALYEPASAIAALAEEAEAGGIDELWVPDSPMLYRDPYVTLGLLAARTRRARLGTLATNPLTRDPAVTANAVLTLQELSEGRAILGIATGDSSVRRLGRRPARLAELERAVRRIRAMLRGEVDEPGGGRFAIRFAGAAASAPPPVHVVASGLGAVALAGRVADGVVLNVGVHPAVLSSAEARMREGVREGGRAPEELEVAVFAFCAIDDDGGAARTRLGPSVSWFGQRVPALAELAGLPRGPAVLAGLARLASDYARYDLVHADRWPQAVADAAFVPEAWVRAFALGGTAAEVAEGVTRLAALGVRRLVIRPPSPSDWRPTVRAFLRDVLPALPRSLGLPCS